MDHLSNNILISRIYKEAWKLNNKMIGNSIKEWTKI